MSARAGRMRRAIRRGVKGVKIAGLVLGAALLVLGAWVAARWAEVSDIPGLPSAYEAKAMCSCLFVEGHTQASCERYARQETLPIQGRAVDTEHKTVTVRALWTSNRARYVSRRFGCVLDPPE